ncbi:MAG: DUF4233 domain-containing protein [Sciscionella sp.]
MSDNAAQAPDSPQPVKGPMRSFRGVMAGTLVIEAVVVALALLVVAKSTGGLDRTVGWVIGVVVLALLATCGFLRRPGAQGVIALLQVVMIACVFLSVPLAVIGVIFALVWGCLFWMRFDVARRMARGQLPSQQQSGPR